MADAATAARPLRGSARLLLSMATLCLVAAAVATAGCAAGAFVAGRRLRAAPCRTACRAEPEAFDPFGWKGKLKDTVEGLMNNMEDEQVPSQQEEAMMIEIFQKYDADKDGILKLEEFNTLQTATEGADAVYNLEQLQSLLVSVNPDIEQPERGMPFADFRRLYVDRRLRQTYSTDVMRDHLKIFGPGYGAAAQAPAEGLAAGTAVKIQGLSGAVELNGQGGHVVVPVESEKDMVQEGRVIVKLGDGERVALKPANVVAAS
mmetsp:Transcript_97351/g.208886  ORF Transcript_97351/g.208886 Transcript_97351/m.208886 type:complete len:261 (-) Transcript_97351:58-840(-)